MLTNRRLLVTGFGESAGGSDQMRMVAPAIFTYSIEVMRRQYDKDLGAFVSYSTDAQMLTDGSKHDAPFATCVSTSTPRTASRSRS
jgi:hypothetical protein